MDERRYDHHVTERGVRRRRRVRALAGLRLSVVGLCLVLLGELLWAAAHSPRLRVRDVRLEGVSLLSRSLILARAAIPPQATLASLSTRRIRRRIEALPAVEQAVVRRDWPRDLCIVIRERKPAAFARGASGIIFVDRRGVAFTVANCAAAGLPELCGFAISSTSGRRAAERTRLAAAVAAIAAAQQAELQVSHVARCGANGLALRLRDGALLVLGPPDQLDVKLGQAKVALTHLQPLRQVEYIDVSCPDAVVWKPRAPAGHGGGGI